MNSVRRCTVATVMRLSALFLAFIVMVVFWRRMLVPHPDQSQYLAPPLAPTVTSSVSAQTIGKPLDLKRQTTEQKMSREEGWDTTFKASGDYFTFVLKAAKPAYEGNGKAAYYISKALQKCSMIVAIYGSERDPDAALTSQLANAPLWAVEMQRKDMQLCRRFLNGNAFEGLPTTSDTSYNKSSYWMELAYRDADPTAQAYHAASMISQSANSPESSRSSFQSAQQDINIAALAGEPAAIFEIGTIISNGFGRDPIQGFALSLAACDLGYDCAAASNQDYFGACVAAGNCPPGATFSDVVTRSVGVQGYADAYARAQQIKEAISRGDQDEILEYVKLRSPARN